MRLVIGKECVVGQNAFLLIIKVACRRSLPGEHLQEELLARRVEVGERVRRLDQRVCR